MTAPAVDVETDLAASILTMWTLVRSDLASAPPRVGRIEGQAEDVFAKHSGHWNALIADACDELAGEHSLPYAKSLGALVSGEAAKGLALGMDIQLNRGQNPEVAWQRVLAGYGLDVRTMRGLLGGAMPTPSGAGGAGAAPDSLARIAERSLLLRAQKLASVEAKAWAAAKEEIAKAFDPRELREANGRWTARPQLLERESEAPEKRSAPTEVKPEGDRLAEVDRYAPTETDRYAAVQTDRYAPTATDRYAAVAAQATEAPAEQDRYAPDDRYAAVVAPAENRVISTTIIFAPKKLGDAPPPPEPPSPPGRRYYFPISDVPEYYHGQGMEMSNHGAGYNSVINFKDIADYYRYNDDTRKLPLQLKFSEWEVVKPVEGITQQKWDTALKYAVPLHKIAMEHPVELAKELGANDLQEIAERAGYQSYAGPGPIRDAIATDFQMSKTDPKGHDPSLMLAMADYVVWSKPEALQHLGQRLKLQAGFQGERRRVDHLAEDLGDTLTMFISKLRLAPIPGVVSFGGGLHGHDAVNPDKITGKYKVQWVVYHSSIAEQGLGADVGKIGFREIKTKPQH